LIHLAPSQPYPFGGPALAQDRAELDNYRAALAWREGNVSAVRAALGEAAFEAARAKAQRLGLAEVVRRAFDERRPADEKIRLDD